MRRISGSALCALVAALGPVSAAPADVPAAPCVGAGLVAVVEPGATAPVTFGPAVAAVTTDGVSADTFADSQHGVELTKAAAGAAGCVRGSAPGGTHAVAATWSVLGGALSGGALRADLVPAGGDGSGWRLRLHLADLRVAGSANDATPGATLAVGDWGALTVGGRVELDRLQPLRFWAAALELRLTRAHAGLPAGTLVLVGYAAANRPPAPPPAPTTTAPPAPTTTTPPAPTAPPGQTTTASVTTTVAPTTTAPPAAPKRRPPAAHPKAAPPRRPSVRRGPGRPLTSTPPLAGGGDHVFPVAAGADWGDSYGGDRSDVPGGWHHGDDLFAPLGTPVVAVADGTIFAVGWNRVGGWRLWLVDHAGNAYYYAHLSGYTRLARNNRAVRRGDAIGFVGNTGDAFTTEPHLHFEVHPTGLLYLGYDGAVDPTSYLRTWPLARGVRVLPPVRLPDGAPSGFGSAADFRRLLAVHPLPAKPHAAATPAAPSPLAFEPRPRAQRVAVSAAVGRGGEGGALPIVSGVLLLAFGLGAVAHAARDGRT